MHAMHKLMISVAALTMLAAAPVMAAPEGGSGSNAVGRPDLDSRNTGPRGQGGKDCCYKAIPRGDPSMANSKGKTGNQRTTGNRNGKNSQG